MNINKIIKPTIIIFIVVSLMSIIYAVFFWGSVSSDSEYFTIDGKTSSKNDTVKLRPWIYEATLYDPLKEPLTKSVTIVPFQNLTLSNTNPELSIEQILVNADMEISSGYRLGVYKFFDNNKWLVIRIVSVSPDKDGYDAILNFKDNKWQKYSAGSYLLSKKLQLDSPEAYEYLAK